MCISFASHFNILIVAIPLWIIQLCVNIQIKIQMISTSDKLKCLRCGQLPNQFVILGCSHPICVDCYGQIDRSQNLMSTVCECDKFSSVRQSTQVASPNTYKQYNSTVTNTAEMISNEEDYVVGSNAYVMQPSPKQQTKGSHQNSQQQHPQPRKEKPISSFELPATKPIRRIKTDQNLNEFSSVQRGESIENKPKSRIVEQGLRELTKELQYVEMQYNKAVEEIKETFRKQLDKFDRAFEEYKERIKVWYVDIKSLKAREVSINFPKYIKERYTDLGKCLEEFQNDIFEFEVKFNKFSRNDTHKTESNIQSSLVRLRSTKERKTTPLTESQDQQPDYLPSTKNVYIINRPWCGHGYSSSGLSTYSFLSPGKYSGNLKKRNAKNFVDDLIHKSKIRRWLDYKL